VLPCSSVEFTDVSDDLAASLFRVGKQTTWNFVQKSHFPISVPVQFLLVFLLYLGLVILYSYILFPPPFFYVHKIPALRITPESTLTLYPPNPVHLRLVYYREAVNSSRTSVSSTKMQEVTCQINRQFSWLLFVVLG